MKVYPLYMKILRSSFFYLRKQGTLKTDFLLRVNYSEDPQRLKETQTRSSLYSNKIHFYKRHKVRPELWPRPPHTTPTSHPPTPTVCYHKSTDPTTIRGKKRWCQTSGSHPQIDHCWPRRKRSSLPVRYSFLTKTHLRETRTKLVPPIHPGETPNAFHTDRNRL